ncbi:MAG: D-alanyl-D-alanine carboxypeptidase [Cyclobacteriaceae bacterium]|nr:D-alanyl-D-alanine carboxypeptidase [Cyclobacteriaceae bacterium]
MLKTFLPAIVLTLIISCSPVSRHALDKTFRQTENRFQDHTGFVLFDPVEGKTIYEFNASAYFTPASNTKIFTFFAGLNIIGDSVPSIHYAIRGDSLIFWGAGDPSFLYRNVYGNNRTFSFLQTTDKRLYFSNANFNTAHFGPGWAWDDYGEAYSAERSAFPIYGNIFSVSASQSGVNVRPSYLTRYMTMGEDSEEPKVIRNRENNYFKFYPALAWGFEKDIPLKVKPLLIGQLLADTLKREVQVLSIPIPAETSVLYSVPADSLYKVMMQDSDNFIAEQLLLLCSGIISDTLQPEIAIKYVKHRLLNDMVDEPVWVDGSGLSRYNLFTPRSIVQLWEKIYQMVPRERLFALLAQGGKSGTIRNWYNGEAPYIFGKTGTLSNNHCMSGYLVTRKGKTLIFSFMNSNFTTSTNNVRRNMQGILNLLYEKY